MLSSTHIAWPSAIERSIVEVTVQEEYKPDEIEDTSYLVTIQQSDIDQTQPTWGRNDVFDVAMLEKLIEKQIDC